MIPFARSLSRGLLAAGACALALSPLAAALDTQDGPPPVAPPDFGVLQFADDEVFIDLNVSLADAWQHTLEVVASLNDAVKADLPYLESNGRIVAGKLWIAVEAQGAPGTNWTRIRIAIPADEPEYGKVRAEIILDAIADRLEPAAPLFEKPTHNYPQLPASVEGVADEYVTNNYYYGSEPYSTYPAYEPYYSPYWYGSLYAPYVCATPYYWSPSYWNTGWWYGWGGPWCNPWGSSFAFGWGCGWNWSFSACFGAVCGSFGSCWWDDCDDWDDCDFDNNNDGDIIVNGGNVVIGNGDVVVGSTQPGLIALAPRATGLSEVPPGDLLASARGENVPHVTDRAARRASEPTRGVVVTRTERGPYRGHEVIAGERPWSEKPTRLPDGPRPRIVVFSGNDDTSTGGSRRTTRTTTSPSRSSHREGPKVVRLGSAPYSARVSPVSLLSPRASSPDVVSGGAPSTSGDRPATIDNHPYSNPFPTSSAPGPSSRTTTSAPHSSPSPSVSTSRSSAPTASPSRSTSAPRASSPSSSGGRSSGGASRGSSSGGSSSGGRSSGGGRGPR
jgi:uncharacterized membrane protein YgcG